MDKDVTKINQKLTSIAKNFHEFHVITGHGQELRSIADDSVSVIVTDPPWGIYEEIDNLEDFYSEMMENFARVLEKDGRLVVLTAQKDLMERVLSDFSDKFEKKQDWDILVSGKKARLYQLIRK